MLCWIQSCSSKDNLGLSSDGSYPKVPIVLFGTKSTIGSIHDEGLQSSLCFNPLNKRLFQAESKICLPTLGKKSKIPFKPHRFHKLSRADHPISLGRDKTGSYNVIRELMVISSNLVFYHNSPKPKTRLFLSSWNNCRKFIFSNWTSYSLFFFFWPCKRGLPNGIEKDYGSPTSEKAMTRSSGDRPPPIPLCWWERADWSWTLIC